MKSTEVYRVARDVLSPWCKAQGFKRQSGGMLGWHKAYGEKHLIFWLQCSRDGWDHYAGSKFAVELQFSPSAEIGAFGDDCIRHRLPQFLSHEELEIVRDAQNCVIRSLPKPPPDHFALHIDERTTAWYSEKFREISGPFKRTDDIWLRYATPENVHMWAEILLRLLPRIVDDIVERRTTC